MNTTISPHRLLRSFYDRPTLTVSRELLGKFLVFRDCVGMITETEAYIGRIDPASHSFRGITPRSQVMFGPSGHAYVYFIYGMYYCFNIVTEKKGEGAAVLIRAVKPISGLQRMVRRRKRCRVFTDLCNGPGKLCEAFGITKIHNNIDLTTGTDFFVEDRGMRVRHRHIEITKRIGLSVGNDKDWRFLLRGDAKETQSQRKHLYAFRT